MESSGVLGLIVIAVVHHALTRTIVLIITVNVIGDVMSRLDWKNGRWMADVETDLIYGAMRGWRDVSGDWVDYYKFNAAGTIVDDIYDEAIGAGRVYSPAVRIPVLHVTLTPGDNQNTDMGFYFNDTLNIICAFDQFIKTGMDYADVLQGNYLKDRVYYNQKVFRVLSMTPRGKIQQRPTMVAIDCTQLKPDELVDDTQFMPWAQPVITSTTP